MMFFFFKQKTAYEMRISDWSSDVCSSDLDDLGGVGCIGRIEILCRLGRRGLQRPEQGAADRNAADRTDARQRLARQPHHPRRVAAQAEGVDARRLRSAIFVARLFGGRDRKSTRLNSSP